MFLPNCPLTLHHFLLQPSTPFTSSTLKTLTLFSPSKILSTHNASSQIARFASDCLQHYTLSLLYSVNMLSSSRNSPGVNPLPYQLSYPLFATLRTSGNAPTLLSAGLIQVFAQPVPQRHSRIQKTLYSNLVSSSSDNPKRLWQTANKLLHHKSYNSYSPLPCCTPGISPTALLPSSQTKYPTFICLFLATPLYIISTLTLFFCYTC